MKDKELTPSNEEDPIELEDVDWEGDIEINL